MLIKLIKTKLCKKSYSKIHTIPFKIDYSKAKELFSAKSFFEHTCNQSKNNLILRDGKK